MAREYKRVLATGDIAKKTTSDEDFVVPNGQTLRIERFSGGYEYSIKETRIELLWDGTILAVGYACGSNFQIAIEEDFVGDGAKKITMRFVNEDSGALNMSAWWEGSIL